MLFCILFLTNKSWCFWAVYTSFVFWWSACMLCITPCVSKNCSSIHCILTSFLANILRSVFSSCWICSYPLVSIWFFIYPRHWILRVRRKSPIKYIKVSSKICCKLSAIQRFALCQYWFGSLFGNNAFNRFNPKLNCIQMNKNVWKCWVSLPGVVWLVERPRECRPRLTLRLVFVGHAIWPSSHDIAGKRQEEVSEPPSEGAMVETFRMHYSPLQKFVVAKPEVEEEYSSKTALQGCKNNKYYSQEPYKYVCSGTNGYLCRKSEGFNV